MGFQSPRGSYLVHNFKADGGPHVCLLFAFRNQPIATPHAASELQLRDDPDFKGIARPNILKIRIQSPDQFLTASKGPGGRAASPPAAGWRVGGVLGDGSPLVRHIRPRHNHLSSERRTNYSLSGKVADYIGLKALFLFFRRSVFSERLPFGQICAAQMGDGGRHGQMYASY